MRYILIILLLLSTQTQGQEPFVEGKSYPIGWVVTYPNSDIQWIALKPVKVATFPFESNNWTRYKPIPIVPKKDTVFVPIQITDPSAITRVTIDSVYKRLSAANVTIDSLAILLSKATERIDVLNNRANILEIPSGLYLKYSLFGTPLINMINDSTGVIRSLVPGEGIFFQPTENTIVINRK